MTNLLNIQIENNVIDELFDSHTLVHSDYLIELNNENDSLLQMFPNELQNIANNELGFYVIKLNELKQYLQNHVLIHLGYVEGTYDECKQFFEDELLQSYKNYYPNTFTQYDPDEYELIDNNIVEQIADYAINEIMNQPTITINNEKYIIDSKSKSKYVNNVHNINWVEQYANNVN